MKVNEIALRTDSQDWRGKDGAKEYAEILGWTLQKLRQEGQANLAELYRQTRPPEWGGEAPADFPLYRAFLHLIEVGAAEGNTVYMVDENGEPLTHSHTDSTIKAGPYLDATRWIPSLRDSQGKILYAEPSREEKPERAAQRLLHNLAQRKSLGSKAYQGPAPDKSHEVWVTDALTAESQRYLLVKHYVVTSPQPAPELEP